MAEDEGKDKGRREDDEGAEEEQEEEEKPRRRWPKNRVVGAVIGGLVLLFVIGALVLGGEEKKPAAAAPPPDLTARALVLPESREQRTVVIAPCEGPLEETVRNAAAGNPTSGAATFSVPASNRARQLVIPRCTPGTGTAPGVPAAAFVFTDDSTTGPIRPGSRLLLPAGSEATTIVVSPCTKETTKRDVALSPREDDPDTVVAPAC